MTLSDKIGSSEYAYTAIPVECVKEFIKELKELIKNNWRQDINEQINNE